MVDPQSSNTVQQQPTMVDPQSSNTVQQQPTMVDPQSSNGMVQQIVDTMNVGLQQRTPHSGSYIIYRIPGSLVRKVRKDDDDKEKDKDKDKDGIRSPLLASFGPCHNNKEHLRPFEAQKKYLSEEFLSRTNKDRSFYIEKLKELKDQIKRGYSPEIAMPNDDKLLSMMLLDGSFIVELFLQYHEGNISRPWSTQDLITDLLNLENQVPFFVLERLYLQISPRLFRNLPKLALKYLSQALPDYPEMKNSVVPNPKHVLDLFRRSLLPRDEVANQSNQQPLIRSIQSVKHLRSVGISMKREEAESLLDIGFYKLFSIPPLALKIPPLAIDGLNNAILVNCVALEQCFQGQTKHFTAYACFMSCLVKEPEDVGYLRSADIINGIPGDEESFIDMLKSIGSNVHSTLRESYLWKQLQEIHCYYNGCCALFISTVSHNKIVLCFSLLTLVLGILTWRLPVK